MSRTGVTDAIFAEASTLVELVRARARRDPDRLAFTFLRNGEAEQERVTYAELDRSARSIAAQLQRERAHGERALLVYPADLEFVRAFLGCLYAGVPAVPVPLPTAVGSLWERVEAIADNAQARFVLGRGDSLTAISERMARAAQLRSLRAIATDRLDLEPDPSAPLPRVTPADTAFLQYTSGSTGTPKGVIVKHADLQHNQALIQDAAQHSSDTVLVSWLPHFHDMGLIGMLLQTLYVGGHCVWMPPHAFLQKPARWLRAISRYRASSSTAPNFAYDLCARLGPEETRGLDLSCWRVAVSGSEPVRAETLERFAHAFEAAGFRREALRPSYGLAEATLFVSASAGGPPVVAEFDSQALAAGAARTPEPGRPKVRLVGCGRVWADRTLTCVDPETREPCAAGRVGEIWVGGGSLPSGYWGDPELSAATFDARLADGRGPFLRTGDLGFVRGGELFIAGRRKDLIIVRGVNHYPQDIERSCELAHPVLHGQRGAAFGLVLDGEERVVVVHEVDNRSQAGLDVEGVARAVRAAVAQAHELALEAVVLVLRGSLPRTSSGKLQRSECRERYLAAGLKELGRWQRPSSLDAEPSPTADLHDVGADEAAAMLERVRQVVARVLGLRVVARDEPLRALGLDSLRAVVLRRELEQTFGLELALEELFGDTTLDHLVERAWKAASGAAPAGAAAREMVTSLRPDEGARYEAFALTGMQQAYWLGRTGAYDLGKVSLHGYAEIEGENVDLERVEQSLRALVEAHDMLRAVLLPTGEQKVLREVPAYRIERLDLSALPAADASEALDDLRNQMSHEVLPLEAWPPFRLRAALLPRGRVRLHVSVDGTFVDFRSAQVLLHDFLRRYADPRAVLGPGPGAPRFRDYVLWQHGQQSSPGHARARAFWQERLDSLPPAPDLPLRVEPALITEQRVDALSFQLPGEVLQKLRARLSRHGITDAALLLAAYVEVLGSWARGPQFTINVPILGRAPLHADLPYAVGNFSSFVLVAADTSTPADIVTRARALQRELLLAVQHADAGGVQLLRELGKRAGRAPASGMPVIFTHFPHGLDGWDRSLAQAVRSQLGEIVHVSSQTPQVWLDNLIVHHEDGVLVTWEVVRGLFPDGMIEAMFAAYRDLLWRLAQDDESWAIDRHELLPAEQAAQRARVNATESPLPEVLLQTLLARQARERPDAPAVACPSKRLTYAQLYARANQLGHALRAQGVSPNRLVAIAMERGWEQVVAVHGTLMAGGAYLPLDIDLPDERIRLMLELGDVMVVLTQSARCTRLRALAGDRAVIAVDQLPEHELPALAPLQTARDLAYVLYTSGSTGTPKGVQVPQRAVLNMLDCTNRTYQVGADDALLSVTNLHHDLSVYDLFGSVHAGAKLVLPAPDMRRDPEHWLQRIEAEQVTGWNSVPALMQMLLDHLASSPGRRLPSLRRAILGGDWVPLDIHARLRAVSDAQLISIGGPTETTVWNIWHVVDRVDPTWRSIPYGKPIANTKYHVLDAQRRDRPVWAVGELFCSGLCLADGYHRDPAATRERFTPHPRSGERLYRTGDLGRYLPDGSIEFVGRADFQLKIRGQRIEPGEIEAALKRQAAVDAAVVVAAAAGGQRELRLVAYLVMASGHTLSAETADALRGALKRILPAHMIPAHIEALERLPLNHAGKVDRLALCEHAQRSQPRPRPAREAEIRSGLERRLTALFEELVGTSAPDPEQNLFELGANSLHVVRLRSEISLRLGATLSVTDIFRNPTIRALTRVLERGQAPSPDVLLGYERARQRQRTRAGTRGDIAIVGMACRFPGAGDVREFWRNLAAGVESIERLTPEELQRAGVAREFFERPGYVPAASAVRDVALFDPDFFTMTQREAAITDPQQRLLLECAHDALSDAGHDAAAFDGAIGVYIGSGYGTYLLQNLLGEVDMVHFDAAQSLPILIGNDKDYAASRVSYKLNLRGPAVSVGTACSSALVAVVQACERLAAGECDLALAGGAKVCVPDRVGYLHQEGGVQSDDGHCRPFDASASGTVFGSGVGVVALRRLEDALADGDAIYAVIRGGAVNNDGADKVSYTAPSVAGQIRVIAEAHAISEIDPESIGYVEAHGTGTALGDPIEVAALTEAFRAKTAATGFCALGSVKSNLGHLDAAAGIAGLIKAALALKHGQIPPSLHFERPNPRIDFERSPFQVRTELHDWPAGAAPRRAGVSSFGIGGTNAHVVLEEAPSPAESAAATPERSMCLLTLSAKSEPALAELARKYSEALQEPGQVLADLCFTSQVGRAHYPHRMAVLASDPSELQQALAAQAKSRAVRRGSAKSQLRVAFLYSGQGGQYAGMGMQLCQAQPLFRRALQRCDDVYRELEDGRSLFDVIRSEDGELQRTRFAQPALFAIEWSLTELWRAWGVQPELVLGHSVGEYAAACAAGVLTPEDALRVLAARGRLMEEHCQPGAMVAVLADAERVSSILGEMGPALAIAAYNGPASTVLAGAKDALAEACQRLEAHGVRAQPLPGAQAFHSPLMEPVLHAFARVTHAISYAAPTLQAVSSCTGEAIAHELAHPDYWVRQLRAPVRFGAAMQAAREHVDVWLELGPGGALTALGQRCLEQGATARRNFLTTLPRAQDEARALLDSLAELYVQGAHVAWRELHRGEPRKRVHLPGYPFQRRRCWLEPKRIAAPQRRGASSERLQLVWRPAPARGEARARHWLILEDAGGLCRELGTELAASGASTVFVRAASSFRELTGAQFEARADTAEDLARILTTQREQGTRIDAILYGWELAQQPGAPETRHARACQGLLHAVQAAALAAHDAPPKLVLLTNGAQQLRADDVLDLGQAPLLGFYRALALEHPELEPLHLDLDPREPLAARTELARDLCTCSAQEQVAYRASERYAARLVHGSARAEAHKPVLRADASYWITGGQGAIGLLLAKRLAALGARQLVLTSRSRELSPAAEQAIADLRAAGTAVRLLPCDVASRAELAHVFDTIDRELPPLRGIVHAAGVLRDGALLHQRWADFSQVLAPKVAGSWHLHELSAGRDLDFFVLCSSAAAMLGSPGQASYAAANSFLDALAAHRRRLGLPAVSIAWAPWAGVGMAASDQARRNIERKSWLSSLSVDEALDQFTLALGTSDAQLALFSADWPLLSRALHPNGPQACMLSELLTAPSPESSADAGAPDRRGAAAHKLLATPAAERRQAITAYVRAEVAEVLGLDSGAQLALSSPLVELGLESLMAITLRNRFASELGLNLPVTLLYDSPTLADLIARFEEALFSQRAAPAAAPKPEDQAQRHIVKQLEELSVAELRSRLESTVRSVLTGEVAGGDRLGE